MDTTREIGNKGEDAACEWLLKNGFTVLERNFTIRGGELDIIAQENDYLVFVEVKTRKSGSMVSGAEAVDRKKQTCIVKAAAQYIYTHPEQAELQPRFDVAEILTEQGVPRKIRYTRNAFDTTGMEILF